MALTLDERLILENGARMSREEFHRLTAGRDDVSRVELIEGVVYMPASIRLTSHGRQQGLVLAWLNAYAGDRTDIECSPPVTLILDDENEVEPDALLFRTDPSRIDADGYLIGAPEMVVEIAASSRSRDLHQKKAAYERNGVVEYIVWRVVEGALDWFELKEGRYLTRAPDASGIIESMTFPGLRLDVPALLRLDRRAVLAALRG